MKRIIFLILIYSIVFIHIGYSKNASSTITTSLGNIEKLQGIAMASNGGAKGCGIGTYTYIYSNGEKNEIKSGLDAIHVFGDEISFETLDIF